MTTKGMFMSGYQVCEFLGISTDVLEAMVMHKKLNRTRLYPKAHWKYYRHEVEKIAGERNEKHVRG